MGSGDVGGLGVDVLPVPPLEEPAAGGVPAEEVPAAELAPPCPGPTGPPGASLNFVKLQYGAMHLAPSP